MAKLEQLCKLIGLDTSEYDIYNPARKAAFHRENFSAFLEGRYYDVEPVTVEVVPSLECNFKCARCTYWQNKSKEKHKDKKRLMRQDVFDLIIEGLKEMYTKSIIFTGGGEPAMNPLYLDFMRQAKEAGFKIGLYTNGALLSRKSIEELLEIKPFFIRVSLNAGTPQTHAAMYGYNNGTAIFDTITENIAELGKLKNQSGISTIVGIGYIMSEKNSFELNEIANLLLKLQEKANGGINYAAFRPEVLYFDGNLNVVTTQPNADIFAKISDWLEEKIGKVRQSGMNILINREGFEHLVGNYHDISNIATSWSASFDYDGRLYITSEHNGMEGFSLGDVKNMSIREIWRGQARKELMGKMESCEIKTLPHFKLKTLNDLLLKIRSLGIFTKEEVQEFYKKVNLGNVPAIDFI